MHYLLAILLTLMPAVNARAANLPRPGHVLVVFEENRSYLQVMDRSNSNAYIHQLANRGRAMTQPYAVRTPASQTI